MRICADSPVLMLLSYIKNGCRCRPIPLDTPTWAFIIGICAHVIVPKSCAPTLLLLDFSLTVKVATLIFISGCGLASSSAKEGKSGFIYNLVKSK